MEKRADISKLITFKKLFSKEMNNNTDEESLPSSLAIFVGALKQKEFTSQQKLSEFLGCNKAHTSRSLAKLQQQGLVEPIKSRNSVIKLTEKGNKLATKSVSKKENFFKKLMKDVSEDEKIIFARVLEKICNNAQKLGLEGE